MIPGKLTNHTMDEKKLKNIHNACKEFVKAIEAETGQPAIVAWGTVEETLIATGVNMGDNFDSHDVEKFCFTVVGRLYNLMDYDDDNEDEP